MKPQLDEIKAALSQIREEWKVWRFPTGGVEIFEKDSRATILQSNPTDANDRFDGAVIAKFPQWLAFLLEENERLNETIKARVQERYDEHLRDADETIEEIREEVRSLREKLGRHTQLSDDLIKQLREEIEHSDIINGELRMQVLNYHDQLERMKKERDKLQAGMDVNMSLSETIINMQEELSEKENSLEYVAMRICQWDADGATPDMYELLDVVRDTIQHWMPFPKDTVPREVKYLDGQYRILDVPHIVLTRPAPNGERFARNIRVNMKLSKMYQHMKESGISVMRFEDFTN